eukprot:TRINITY_DN1664_c0_g1_i1.p1 TRINITY_DN1664_c0_g1~~TRINITY_DN1664_c0_g1_i1.p1  ORF type:complete len:467 (+),score=35.94 TRINITY_DN1664_c0_g1_i1:150-1550(+)
MKFVTLISIFYCSFFYDANADQTFSGFQVSLSEDLLFRKNLNLLKPSLESLKEIPSSTIWFNETAWALTFATKISELKVTAMKENLTTATHSLQDSVLTLSAPKSITIDYSFTLEIIVKGIHLISGTGTASISADTFLLTQNYSEKYPLTTLNAEFNLASVEIKAGAFGNIFANSVSKLIVGSFKETLYPFLSGKLSDISSDLSNEVLISLEEISLEFPDRVVALVTTLKDSVTKVENGIQQQVFFLDAVALTGWTSCRGELSTNSSYVSPTKLGVHERICFHFELFPAIMSADAVCGHLQDTVNLTEWSLAGHASELFRFLPELANEYNPQDIYTVARDVLPSIESKPDATILTKTYAFIMSKTGETVLHITADFKMTLEMTCDYPKHCTKVISSSKDVELVNMSINTIVQSPYKALLMSYMHVEASSMNGKPLFVPGVPVPESHSEIMKTDGQKGTVLCVEHQY